MAGTKANGAAARLGRWLRDPLFAFLLIGAAIFAVDVWLRDDQSRTVVVTQAQADRLAALWAMQMGRPPSASELAALIEDHVREDILVREAKRLELGEGDVIVRRRLAQKLSFLTEDVAALEPVDDDALRRFFQENRQRYETPAMVSFSHIYFSPDRRQDVRADALAALASLDPDGWRIAGDPFLLGRTYAHASFARIRKDFGAPFAEQIGELEADAGWQGPLQSGYGAHLVRVDSKTPARGADYRSVAERVAADFDADRRAEANRAYFEHLRSQYTVVLP